MKKIVCIFWLQIICGIVCVNAQESYAFQYSFYSSESEGNVATIWSITCSESADVVIPETVEHEGFIYYVRRIHTSTITGGSYLRKITLPKGALSVALGSYGSGLDAKNLRNVNLNEGLQQIGSYCFHGCPSLSFIEIPSSVKTIGTNAFSQSGLQTVIINSSGEFRMETNDHDSPIASSYPLYGCSSLSTIIYTNPKAPKNWATTTRTYVPDKTEYSSPYRKLTNTSHIIEMITFNENTFDYTGNVPVVTWSNNVEGYTATLDIKGLSADAGTHVDTIPATFTNGEHTFVAKIPYRYTIKPVVLTAKIDNASREYGEDNPRFNITYSGFLSGDSESAISIKPTVSTIATKTSNVGEYPITISGGSATNYEFVYEPGVLTVTKAPLSAKVNDATKVYGSQNPSFTIDYYGLKNGETTPAWTTRPTFQTDATQSSGVGTYAVKALNGVPVNYDLGEITAGTLSITPALLTIKANDAVRQYYGDEPNYSYKCTGFMNGDDESVLTTIPQLSTSATRTSNVGTYEIKVGETSSPNYSISYVNGTLTISPRTLTASVGNYERVYNEENPAFEVSYMGFVNNEDEKVLNTKPTASTTATKASDVGSYPINLSNGSADNYTFSYTSGTLTINKAEQTISWEQDLSNLKMGDQVELKATSSSGLPITYTMDSNSAAEIYSAGSKTYLDCKTGGQFMIRAIQNGNKNYYSSPRATNMVTIVGSNPPSDPILTIKQADEGYVSTQVSKGSVYTFTISASSGWKIHSVSFNNSDVTNQLSSDNTFTTPQITSNSTLSIVYEKDASNAVSSTRKSSARIQATSFGIRVTDADNDEIIHVYSTDGILQKSVRVTGEITDIPLTKNNVYIIKVGTKTMKLFY